MTPTADGSIVDYRLGPELRRKASFDAWIRRLVECRIDVVVLLTPPPDVETPWVTSHPELFKKIVQSADGRNAAFEFRRDAAKGLLAEAGGGPSGVPTPRATVSTKSDP